MTAALCRFWNNGESKTAVRKRTQRDDGGIFAPKRRRLDPRELLTFPTATSSDSILVENEGSRFLRKQAEVNSTWEETDTADTSPKRRRLDLAIHQQNDRCLTDSLESSTPFSNSISIHTPPMMSTTIPPRVFCMGDDTLLSPCRAMVVWKPTTTTTTTAVSSPSSLVSAVKESNDELDAVQVLQIPCNGMDCCSMDMSN